MLKLLYKTLLVSVLSGSLLFLNFQVTGSRLNINFNSAQAESFQATSIDNPDTIATLTMVAIGLITQRLWTCKMSTDMLIAAGAGGAFVIGDVVVTAELKNKINDLNRELDFNKIKEKNGDTNQKQIEVLQRLKDSYQSARTTANTKKTLQEAAAVIFGLAAIASGIMAVEEVISRLKCQIAVGVANSCVGTPNGCTPVEIAALGTDFTTRITLKPSVSGQAAAIATQSSFIASHAALTAALAAQAGIYTAAASAAMALVPVGTAAAAAATAAALNCTTQVGLVNAACVDLVPLLKVNEGFCPVPIALVNNEQKPDNYRYAFTPIHPHITMMTFIKNFFVSNAKADLLSPLGIVSSAAVAFMMLTSKTLGAYIDTFLLAPLNRTIIWGVLAGMSYLASDSTDNQVKTIDENIAKIDGILNSMNALANGVKAANVTSPTIQTSTIQNANMAVSNYQSSAINVPGGQLPCITGNNSANCPSFGAQLNALPAMSSMPSFVQSQVAGITKFVDGINGKKTISAGTLGEASLIAGRRNAINGELKKQQAALQSQLKASGSKVDLAIESKKFGDGLNSILKKELDKGKTSAGAMLASFGGGSASSTDAKKAPAAKMPTAPVFSMPAASPSPSYEEPKSPSSKVAAEPAAQPASTASLSDYEIKNNDITSDKDTSIFDVISNRYNKSYDKLFKKVK